MENKAYIKEYERWLSASAVDSETKAELEAIKGDEGEIKLRFIQPLEFGTAGLRGVMKAGINAMNVYTVAHATQGLSELIKSEGACERGVVIAYDSRNNSALFAKTAAAVLAENGIKTYIFDSLRPTPELSFAIRELKCIAGINITASHNPKQYNGYKAYWEDGAQLPPEHAAKVSESQSKFDIFDDVKRGDYDKAVSDGRITVVGKALDDRYVEEVIACALNPDAVRRVSDDFKLIYTPLHGAGAVLVPHVLKAIGVKELYTVEEQMAPDGNFPTVEKPNPEIPAVFELGINLASKIDSDLIIATDPDADRVGAMSRCADGSFKLITGNQMGALLLDYIITARKETGALPADSYVVKSIVSTELAAAICAKNGIKLHNVLTGFKFIGEVIKNSEESGVGTYLLGFEESYGYLVGTYARDKDAVSATMMIAEMAAYYKAKGMTLSDALEALYREYGYFGEAVRDIYMEGLDGSDRIKRIMVSLRQNPPKDYCGTKIAKISDYASSATLDVASGRSEDILLPKSDVLYFTLENGDVVIARPSGTEPKIKFYFLLSGSDAASLEGKKAAYIKESDKLLCD